MSRSFLLDWRNRLRDTKRPALDVSAKAVGFVLSTYANADGSCFPGLEKIGDGASLSSKSAGLAVSRLQRAGFIEVQRSKGRGSHRYKLVTPKEVPGSERPNTASTSGLTTPQPGSWQPPTRKLTPANTEAASHESEERKRTTEGGTTTDITDEVLTP